MPVYPYADFFVPLYHLRPLLYNSSDYHCIWNNAFHSNMACHRAVVGKRVKSLIWWKKNRKKNFYPGKRVFLIRNDARSSMKMVSMPHKNNFGSKIAFFWRLGKIMCLRKNQQKREKQRIAFILTMHLQKSTNLASLMISNEYPSIWVQKRLSSSIRREITAQQRQRKLEKWWKKIGRTYEMIYLLLA